MTTNLTGKTLPQPPDLPSPSVRYVVMPQNEPAEGEAAEVGSALERIVREQGKLIVRLEVRFWDPLKENYVTWRGMGLNVHFDALGMAEAVVEGVREWVVKGQKVDEAR